MIREIEELSLNAWPALDSLFCDGWILRFAGGYTRRANSVNPIYPSSRDAKEKIRYCEELYTAQGLDTVFKLTSESQPTALDAILEDAGYLAEARTSVQTLSLDDLTSIEAENINFSTAVSTAWIADYCRLSERHERDIPRISQLLEKIVPQKCFLTAQHNSSNAALGLGVVERGYVGLFDIVTAKDLRNRGLGKLVVQSLLNWGKHHGAQIAYLQVMTNNRPAIHLYQKLGFREAYQYWYRVKAAR